MCTDTVCRAYVEITWKRYNMLEHLRRASLGLFFCLFGAFFFLGFGGEVVVLLYSIGSDPHHTEIDEP